MTPQNDVVKFSFNVPQLVNLKFAGPKLINTKFGERALFTLQDGRVMFLETSVAESIEVLGIRPGEEFFIAKRSSKDRGPNPYWDVWLAPNTEQLRAKKEVNGANGSQPVTPHDEVHPQSQEKAQSSSQSIPETYSAWAESIKEQTKIKLAIYNDLCVWAKGQFEGITKNEVRAIMMNVLISNERNGVRR
jgi:hypothetical protein